MFLRIQSLLAIGLLTLSASNASAESRRVTVKVDSKKRKSEATIPARGNRIFCQDFCDAMARLFGCRPKPKDQPKGPSFSADGLTVKGSTMVMDRVLRPHVRVRASKADGNALKITVDHESIMNCNRELKRNVRHAVAAAAKGPPYGIDGVDTQSKSDIVLLIHGLNSRPEDMLELSGDIVQAGFDCATFRYPNDQPLADSAHLLTRELTELKQVGRGRRVSIVAHSMGGLVSRYVLESPKLDPGNVHKLIMIGTPNHGSSLARYGHSLDVWEYAFSPNRRAESHPFVGSIIDGLAEAVGDLRPESMFLARLNAMERNANVSYAHFLGTGGYFTRNRLERFAERVRSDQRRGFAGLIGSRIDSIVADMDEVVVGKGDGLVSVKRGRLAGVEDEVILDFHHNEVFAKRPSATVLQLRRHIVARL